MTVIEIFSYFKMRMSIAPLSHTLVHFGPSRPWISDFKYIFTWLSRNFIVLIYIFLVNLRLSNRIHSKTQNMIITYPVMNLIVKQNWSLTIKFGLITISNVILIQTLLKTCFKIISKKKYMILFWMSHNEMRKYHNKLMVVLSCMEPILVSS